MLSSFLRRDTRSVKYPIRRHMHDLLDCSMLQTFCGTTVGTFATCPTMCSKGSRATCGTFCTISRARLFGISLVSDRLVLRPAAQHVLDRQAKSFLADTAIMVSIRRRAYGPAQKQLESKGAASTTQLQKPTSNVSCAALLVPRHTTWGHSNNMTACGQDNARRL
eukprot:TRINITY_DN49305_c0_g1_i1.p2 TRINITY_DN49305_c0_g1~~TRINITY_DN49305_c0_g1_i1.p2  ORF type:complete len:165 (+),score=12.30 TRINITY_DN49305_c0_g1_i1:640-1134(+)